MKKLSPNIFKSRKSRIDVSATISKCRMLIYCVQIACYMKYFRAVRVVRSRNKIIEIFDFSVLVMYFPIVGLEIFFIFKKFPLFISDYSQNLNNTEFFKQSIYTMLSKYIQLHIQVCMRGWILHI